ncbi:hypothetical protein ACFOEE_04005 [Pseudoalteromonas fenneropenaei]|uniref:Uncharacterized protein n=1 Tax=Pseudoalteromonas fenneropenaei TaxID=1737459 RepID=A0ABV7CGD1_9GAMM
MNIANKQTLFKFILDTLREGVEKSSTELMEEYIASAQIIDYHKKNVKQQFHRAAINLVKQGLISAKKYPDIRYLLFSKNQSNPLELEGTDNACNFAATPTVEENGQSIDMKLAQLEDEEASLVGREEGLHYLIALKPENGAIFQDELKHVRHERMRINAFRSVIESYGI